MNIGIIGVLRQCVHSVLWLWKISDWLTTGAVQEFWFWLLPFVPTAFWDSLSVPGVSQVEVQTKTKLHRQQQAFSLLVHSTLSIISSCSSCHSMWWENGLEQHRAVESKWCGVPKQSQGNFWSAPRVQCPRGFICVSFAPFLCDATWRINTAAWWGWLLLC